MKHMKKIVAFAVASVLLGGAIGASAMHYREVKKASAEATHFTFGDVGDVAKNGTSGSFSFINDEGCEAIPGKIADKDSAKYWDVNHYNSFENFFIGESYGWKGTIRSATWVQSSTNKYVFLTWAGNDQVLKILTTADEDDDGNPDLVTSLTNDEPNGNSMVVNFVEIPAKYLTGTYTLYLEIYDGFNDDAGYRFSTFGYVHVNASAEEVSDAVWAHIDTYHYHETGEEKERLSNAMNSYGHSKYKAITPLSSSGRNNVDESFDDNATFLANWSRDASYDENVNLDHINDVISHATHHTHERQPFNATGGFFKGYYEPAYTNSDFSEANETKGFGHDGFKYRFVSKPFVLSGSGFVSIKMSGHSASFHILKGWREMAFIDNKANSRAGTNTNITTGYNALTMVRHIINLNAFKGEMIQVAFADVNTGGDYGAINVDELITYYPSNPTFKVDTVVQSDSIHHYYIDKYVPMTNSNEGTGGIDYKDDGAYNITSDNSEVQKAYTFLQSFYSTVRNVDNDRKFSWCDTDAGDLAALKTAYATLSEDATAKAIADASEDFHYGDLKGNLVEGDYWLSSIYKGFTVGQTMNAINTGVLPAPVLPTAYGINAANSDTASLVIIISVAALLTITCVGFILFKKRKENN